MAEDLGKSLAGSIKRKFLTFEPFTFSMHTYEIKDDEVKDEQNQKNNDKELEGYTSENETSLAKELFDDDEKGNDHDDSGEEEEEDNDQDEEESLASDDESGVTDSTEMDQVIFGFQHDFTIIKLLQRSKNRRSYAVKAKKDQTDCVITVTRDSNYEYQVNGIPREIKILQTVSGHPNICQFLGWVPVFLESDDIDEFEELADAKHPMHYAFLTKYYINCDPTYYTQGNFYFIAKYMQDVFQGLKHLKQKGVYHRDIAVENIVWDPISQNAVIIDFDTACFARPGGSLRDCGRSLYYAPEKVALLEEIDKVFDDYENSNDDDRRHIRKKYKNKLKFKNKPYNESADVYSAGIILWMLLNQSRNEPKADKLKKWIRKIKKTGRNKKCKELDLLLGLLYWDSKKRSTPEEALKHPFFQQDYKSEETKKTLIALYQELEMPEKVKMVKDGKVEMQGNKVIDNQDKDSDADDEEKESETSESE